VRLQFVLLHVVVRISSHRNQYNFPLDYVKRISGRVVFTFRSLTHCTLRIMHYRHDCDDLDATNYCYCLQCDGVIICRDLEKAISEVKKVLASNEDESKASTTDGTRALETKKSKNKKSDKNPDLCKARLQQYQDDLLVPPPGKPDILFVQTGQQCRFQRKRKGSNGVSYNSTPIRD